MSTTAADIARGLALANGVVVPDAEADQRKAEERLALLRSTWNAPLKHVRTTWDELRGNDKWTATFKALEARLGTGALLALVGDRGRGKTQLAVQLMKVATRKGQSALYTDALGFFLKLKATFGGKGTEEAVVDWFCVPGLLVVDEYGKRGESAWHEDLLFCVLNRRYNAEKDTLLLDNRKTSEFEAAVGPSLASRMHETGGIVECSWLSFRK